MCVKLTIPLPLVKLKKFRGCLGVLFFLVRKVKLAEERFELIRLTWKG